MSTKKIKPTTPGQRFRVSPNFSNLTKSKPNKSLLISFKKISGRNNTGKITVKNRGGGHKRRTRIIDFKRKKHNIPAKVYSIEYDPNRTARIAMLNYYDGYKSYIIAPEGLKKNDIIISGENSPLNIGNTLPLKNIPIGTIVHNIELKSEKGASIARSAGSYAQLLAKKNKYSILKLPSGQMRMILSSCSATIGIVSNSENINVIKGKAGRNRWLGRRPRVRGVSMNPVDHPMGGGEGKASGGHPKSKQGLYSKGKKTRKIKKYSNKLIIKN